MNKIMTLSSIALVSACMLSACALTGKNDQPLSPSIKTEAKEITINTRDNLNVFAYYYIPEGKEKAPVVVLLHMLGKTHSSWNKFIPLLLENGYAVYAVDLRGHGRSTKIANGREIFYDNMNEMDWKKLPDDVYDVIRFISQNKHIDNTKIGIIGASIGANSAIISASKHPDLAKIVVALSPGLDYHGLTTLDAAKNLKTPTLIAVSKDDDYAYTSSNQLNNVVKVKHDLLIYNGKEHGTNLLDTSEDLKNKIISWLNEYLK